MADVIFPDSQESLFTSNAVVVDNLGWNMAKALGAPERGFLSGDLPSYYARYAAGAPATDLTLELYNEGGIVARTTTGPNGEWRFDDLDITKRYDIVVKHPTLEGTLSRDRLPKPYTMTLEGPFDRSQRYMFNPDVYRISVYAKNHLGTLTASIPVGIAVVDSIDQRTGEIVVSVWWYPGTPCYLRVQDGHSLIDLEITPPSRSDIDWANVKSLLRFDNIGTPTTFPDEANPAASWTPTGTVSVSATDSKFGGASALFSGGNSFLTGPAPNLGSSFTMELWFKIPSYPSGTNVGTSIFHLCGLWGSNGAKTGFQTNVSASLVVLFDGRPGFYSRNFYSAGERGGASYAGVAGTVLLNTWHHMALTYDQNTGWFVLFLDGKPVVRVENTDPGSYPPLNFPAFPSALSGTYIGAGTCVSCFGTSTGTLYNPIYPVPDGTFIDSFRLSASVKYPSGGFTPPTNDFLGAP